MQKKNGKKCLVPMPPSFTNNLGLTFYGYLENFILESLSHAFQLLTNAVNPVLKYSLWGSHLDSAFKIPRESLTHSETVCFTGAQTTRMLLLRFSGNVLSSYEHYDLGAVVSSTRKQLSLSIMRPSNKYMIITNIIML